MSRCARKCIIPFLTSRHLGSIQRSWTLSLGLRGLATSLCKLSLDIPHHHISDEPLLTQSYYHRSSSVGLVGKTIGKVLDETAERFPDREAMVFFKDGRRSTFADFREEVERLAAGLLALGLRRGDRVGIWGQNHMEWMLTFYAAAKAGIILVTVNPAYKAMELEYALNKVQMKALLLMPAFKTTDYYAILKEIVPEISSSVPGELCAKRAPHLTHVIMTEGPARKGTFSFEDILNFGGIAERQRIVELQDKIQFDEPANIQFTSGTTGNPKGAVLSHYNLVNNAFICGQVLDYRQPTRCCIPVPLYHCFGMVIGSLNCMAYGATALYPCRGFDALSTLETIHHERCTSVYGTPVMFIDMLNHPDFSKFDYTSLRTGVMAGSPCPIDVMRQIIKDMNCSEMTIAYGLTETSPVTNLCERNTPVDLRVSTIGRIVPHMEVKVVDEKGKIVPVNTTGELCYRGHAVMLGYWQDEKKTSEAIDSARWFHTGDLGVIDENGYCKVVGRLKDLIIRGGENIYPTEVENFLFKYPKVEDVQVIGVPDARMGEEVCAWIKLKRNQDCTVEEIKEFCHGKISHFKIPRYVKFVKEFPMTVTGKVKKFEMRNKMAAELRT